MDFTRRLLELHIVQADNALRKARSYSYSDNHKEHYQEKLYGLFDKIKLDIETSNPTTDVDIFKYKKHLDFIFKSLEFLGSSTLNLIPYEIVECLNYAMNDWINPTDKYIIVTSLINNNGEFSFDPYLAFIDQLYDDIDRRYGIKFDRRLIQINLPRSLSRDYLSAVVLYHELGHFIDRKFLIVQRLVNDLKIKYNTGKINAADLAEIKVYIPFFEEINKHNYQEAIYYHLSEYYCDLFASQYIGEASNHFLSYITEKTPNYAFTHPSTQNRIKVVSDFVTHTTNIIVQLINEAVNNVKGYALSKRFSEINSEDFYNLIPINIGNVSELHGIFGYAWKMWLDENNELNTKLELQKPIASEKIYSIINNLTEKSIGNYITFEKWKLVQP